MQEKKVLLRLTKTQRAMESEQPPNVSTSGYGSKCPLLGPTEDSISG